MNIQFPIAYSLYAASENKQANTAGANTICGVSFTEACSAPKRALYSLSQITPDLKKFILLAAASFMMGASAFAQSAVELTRGQRSADEDDGTDTAVAMSLPTQKGSSFLGCTIAMAQLDAAEFDADKTMHYQVGMSPRYGYFLANNFALGGEINTSIDGFTRINQYTVMAGAGIFARLYTGKAATQDGTLNKVRFFAEGGIGYGYAFYRLGDAALSGNFDYGALQTHLMPGINYFANRNVAFELGLNYSYQHTVMNEDYMKDDHHSLLLSLGLQFFFCKR